MGALMWIALTRQPIWKIPVGLYTLWLTQLTHDEYLRKGGSED